MAQWRTQRFRNWGLPIKLDKSKANGKFQEIIVQLNSGCDSVYRCRIRFVFTDCGIACVYTKEGLDLHEEHVFAVEVIGYYDLGYVFNSLKERHEEIFPYDDTFEKFYNRHYFLNKPHGNVYSDLPARSHFHIDYKHGDEIEAPITMDTWYTDEDGKKIVAKSWAEFYEAHVERSRRESHDLAIRLMTIGIHDQYMITKDGDLIVRPSHSAITQAVRKGQQKWPERELKLKEERKQYHKRQKEYEKQLDEMVKEKEKKKKK